MQTWAKRGLQTAFVTGGLLMLGTGIASAQENVDPDAAPPAVDVAAAVPIKADQNKLATPVKEITVPKVDRTISTDRVTSAVPTRTAAPVANPLVRQAGERLQGTPLQNLVRGNTIQAHVDVPINICGNAIAVLANTEATGDCSQNTHRDGTIVTDGAGQALAGNVVAVNHVLPVQLTGNAIAAGGNATTNTDAQQVSTTGGDITTNGDKGAISGNVVAEHGATPVQITGNGVGAAGIADANSTADTFASSEGDVLTSGKNSSISGNAVPLALAPLAEVNGNAAAAASNATTDSVQSGTAYAGGKTDTNGDPATLAGNVVAPALSGPVTVDDNAAAAGGNATAVSETTNESIAGGIIHTFGDGSTASGNIAGAPVALPTSAGGNGASIVGNALTDHTNKSHSKSGGEAYTVADHSVLSGNIADLPPATAIDVCGNGATLAGQAAGTCENDVKSITSGYQGTTGTDSVISGNIASTPVATPAEVYGLAAALGGQATGSADEVKVVRSSGTPNTEDDNGTVSSNIVTAPTAAAPQVFAVTAGLVGNTVSDTSNDTTVEAGNNPHATGKKSSASGNIVQVPTSTPAQVFADGATLVGNNKTTGDNATDMKAGGDALTTGEQGSIAGNVVSAPVATGTQVLGWSVGGGSNVDAFSTNDLSSVAGGDVNSNGDGGSVSGNLIGAQPAVLPAVPGNTVAAAGITNSDVVSDTNVVSGADSYSTADDASVSGNLIHVPANAVAGVYADSVAAAGNATTVTDKTSYTQAGGEMLTEGSGPLSAREMTVPVEAAAKVARIPVEVVGQATTLGTSDDTQLTGEDTDGTLRAAQLKGLELPKGVDSLLKANEVPTFHGLDSKLPVNQLPNPADLAALAGQLPTPALPAVAQERSALPVNGGTAGLTPNVQGLPLGQVLEAAKGLIPAGATERSLPSLPITAPALPVPVQLPALPTERSLPTLPVDGPASLSGLNLNPTQGLAPQADERALPQLPFNAPALAMIDPANLFQTVTGSL
ncbi:Small secreted domain [Lentzea waywayandensis]|uniref:Small secreted domain n=1 Tax=Lentzea waywayandensis TaxID=84724 RepID=A0A1I6EIE4_9PSEU|nr:chaplin family protein [Lentzea waywayandensis]SFR17510.1 Small secreted domain [Lentzea waywayandensis]